MWRTLIRRESYTTPEGRPITYYIRIKRFYEGILKKTIFSRVKSEFNKLSDKANEDLKNKYSEAFKQNGVHLGNVVSDFTSDFFQGRLLVGSTGGEGLISIPNLKENDFVFVTPLTSIYSPYVRQDAGENGIPINEQMSVGYVKIMNNKLQVYGDKKITYFIDSPILGEPPTGPFYTYTVDYAFVQIIIIPGDEL